MNIAVILAGGKGLRLGGDIPKQMLLLGSKPVISWSVDTFHNNKLVDKIIIVSEHTIIDEIKRIFPAEKYKKIISFIEGGKDRSDSSYNAINSYNFADNDIILFHDAARPFVSDKIINSVIENTWKYGACGSYIKAIDTVTMIENSVLQNIPDRNNVYYAQTPQGFRYHIIKRAHEEHRLSKGKSVTDDVSLVYNIGLNVFAAEGSSTNIKITNKNDMDFAEYLISGGKI